MTVEEGTLVHALWREGHYRPPRLWALVEIVRQASFPKLYVSPFKYSVEALDSPRNCGKCDDYVAMRILNHYNVSFDRTTLSDLNCECLHKTNDMPDDRSIPERAIMMLDAVGIL